jgi:CBS domain-containing protein
MIESQIMQLPVFAGKKLKGLITSEQVIDSAVGGNQGQTRVVQLMTKKPLVVSKDETVGEVLNLFREHGISHSPVTHDGGLQGIVSIQDIIDIAYRSRNRQTSGERVGEKVDITDINVGGIMRFPVVTVDPEETLRNCTKKMSENDVSCLVVARNDRVLGIVTKKDFLELVAQTIPQTRPFTVQFSVKPDVRVRLDSQEVMIDAFESFAGKYEDALGSGILFVYIKSLGSGSKAHQLVQCRFQLRTTKGLFHSSSEAWGTIDAFLLALERLERRVIQSKEMELDSEYVRRHIEDYLSSEK